MRMEDTKFQLLFVMSLWWKSLIDIKPLLSRNAVNKLEEKDSW